MKNFIVKCLVILLSFVVLLFMGKLTYDSWGGPDGYFLLFFTVVTFLTFICMCVVMVMGDKFLYKIYGEPSNRNPW